MHFRHNRPFPRRGNDRPRHRHLNPLGPFAEGVIEASGLQIQQALHQPNPQHLYRQQPSPTQQQVNRNVQVNQHAQQQQQQDIIAGQQQLFHFTPQVQNVPLNQLPSQRPLPQFIPQQQGHHCCHHQQDNVNVQNHQFLKQEPVEQFFKQEPVGEEEDTMFRGDVGDVNDIWRQFDKSMGNEILSAAFGPPNHGLEQTMGGHVSGWDRADNVLPQQQYLSLGSRMSQQQMLPAFQGTNNGNYSPPMFPTFENGELHSHRQQQSMPPAITGNLPSTSFHDLNRVTNGFNQGANQGTNQGFNHNGLPHNSFPRNSFDTDSSLSMPMHGFPGPIMFSGQVTPPATSFGSVSSSNSDAMASSFVSTPVMEHVGTAPVDMEVPCPPGTVSPKVLRKCPSPAQDVPSEPTNISFMPMYGGELPNPSYFDQAFVLPASNQKKRVNGSGRTRLPDAPLRSSASSTSSHSGSSSAPKGRSSSDKHGSSHRPKPLSEIRPKPVRTALPESQSPPNTTFSAETLQRTKQDEYLVQSKQKGMTYKDIKREGNFKEAESTLRGRYRTLTKPKTARVRKPEWKPSDDDLLKLGVAKFVKRPDTASAKVPWKKVAEWIAENGASYEFGNSTCCKRWEELKGQEK